MKKALSLFLSILFLLTALPLGAIPVAAATVSGTTGDCTWTLDDDGHLTISGNGAMWDYDVDAAPWRESEITSVTIEYGVTTIGYKAFYNCIFLVSAIIPDSVITIGDEAFHYCDSLTSVTIPDSVTTIGDHAFGSCTSLTSMTIPESVTTIGDYAFSFCDSLTSVTIPDSVTTIGNGAFYDCSSLVSAIIPDSVTTIGERAFFYCTSLTSVTIGDSVTTIGDYAFYYCTSLASVTIGDSVTTIGDCAFRICTTLASVTIGDSVTSIGHSAFYYCTYLTDVYYAGTEADKTNMSIGTSNDPLLNATWHYHEHSYDNVCDAGCNDCGDIREPAHAYDHAYDTTCNECGAIREVEMFPVTFGGNSVSKEVSGLAFKFIVDAIGMTTIDRTTAVYDNATVNGHRLLSMGAVVSNAVESVDIPAVYLFDWSDTNVTYAVRLINIPADQYDTTITAIPYFVLEIDGIATTIYGEAQTASMNGVMNA